MTLLVDFLPASYRQRQQQRHSRRWRLALGLVVLSGVVATDVLFRHRISTIRHMERKAIEHAEASQQRSLQELRLEERIAALREELARWTAPLITPKASALLDELVADCPEDVRFHALLCRIDPWAEHPLPQLQLEVSSEILGEFSGYLTRLQASDLLPRLACQNTGSRRADGRQGFRLETERKAP